MSRVLRRAKWINQRLPVGSGVVILEIRGGIGIIVVSEVV